MVTERDTGCLRELVRVDRGHGTELGQRRLNIQLRPLAGVTACDPGQAGNSEIFGTRPTFSEIAHRLHPLE